MPPHWVRVLVLGSALMFALWPSAPAPATAAPGELRGGVPPAGGYGLLLWGGGAVDALQFAARAAGCEPASVWVSQAGRLVGHIFHAPGVVNAPFLKGRPDGVLAPDTPIILTCASARPARAAAGVPRPRPDLPAPDVEALLPPAAESQLYLRGRRAIDADDPAAALTPFGTLAETDGVLAPMARLRQAQMLARLQLDSEAAALFQQAAVDPGLPVSLQVLARLEGADLLDALGREAEALALLRPAPEDATTSAGRARAAWHVARLQQALDDPAWVTSATAVLTDHAGRAEARAALAALHGAGVGVSPLAEAYVHYRSFQNTRATDLYRAIAASSTALPAERAIAWFYLGALAERSDSTAEAIAAYGRSSALDPAGPVADDSYWWRALLLEDAGRVREALADFSVLSEQFPGSAFAPDAAFRAAVLEAELGASDDAIARLRRLAQGGGSNGARAARWIQVLGDASGPGPTSLDPGSLWAVLERVEGNARRPLGGAATQEWVRGDADWGAAATWMTERFGPRPAGPRALDDPALRLALALDAAGESAVARTLLYDLVEAYGERPYDLLDLARVAGAVERYDVQMEAGRDLLKLLTPHARLTVPLAVGALAYPAPFQAETLAAARAEQIPPLLLLALVRQESAFNPAAGSSAGAQGLTQVIPSTGREIAQSLGRPFDPADLLVPTTSLRYGAHYLAQQLRGFDGDLWAALAAYNAGGGNARRWLAEERVPGVEGYIQTVDFSETRRYLQIVAENYAWYRYLYGWATAPALPE